METMTAPNIATVGDDILGPDGVLAETLPGYEARRPQMLMANLCGRAITENRHALMEAGTGTGKSLAYLIPAILAGKRVVVSTDTIALQQQLIDKDLPFLARALGRPIRYAIAKGRSNYLCERNALSLTNELQMGDLAALTAQEALAEFGAGRWDGDKANLRLTVPDARWALISGEDSCTGSSCQQRERCPYLLAKERYEDADIIVTNHTMYLLHHYVSQRTGGTVGILPAHAVWIADEAHTLSDKAVDVFGIEVSHTRPAAFLKRLVRQAKVLGVDLGTLDTQAVHKTANALFSAFHGAPKEQMLLKEFPPEIVELARERMEALVAAIKPIRLALYWAGAKLDPDLQRQERAALERLYGSADLLIENLSDIFAPPTCLHSACEGQGCPECEGTGRVPLAEDDHVVYVEVSADGYGDRAVTLHRKPIETRPIFQRILSELESALFCSATLAAGSGPSAWRPAIDELGLENDVLTMQVESPFDYARQVIGYVPTGIPESRSPEYHTCMAASITEILNYTQGRAFVLFTARRDLERIADLVRRQVRWPLLAQGDMPKDELIRRFKELDNAVLFGNKTFWQGVDIPGDALSCVIIAKLPFPQFDHPLNRARCERIKRRGGNDFGEFSLPRCIRDVRQGFGRLIRSRTDEGVFVILDNRLREKDYGRQIANALPTFPVVRSL